MPAAPDSPSSPPPTGRAPRVGLRAWVNRVRRKLWHALFFRMLFGERSPQGGRLLANTRIAPSTCIEGSQGLRLGDHVFIGQFNFIEASAGLDIGEGVQITNFCSIVTHSTHRSIRLMGRLSAAASGERLGDVRAPVSIGAYSYVGPHSLVEAGSRIGRGSLVAAYSRVRGQFPDFAVLAGNPAQVVGDTRERDAAWLAAHPEIAAAYGEWARAPQAVQPGTRVGQSEAASEPAPLQPKNEGPQSSSGDAV